MKIEIEKTAGTSNGAGRDIAPVAAAIGRAEQAAIGCRDQRLAIGAESQAVDVMKVAVVGRRQLLPADAAVVAAEHAGTANRVGVEKTFASARIQPIRIARVHDQTGDRQIGHEIVDRLPAGAAIIRGPDAAAGRTGPQALRIARMNQQAAHPAADIAWALPLPTAAFQTCRQ